MHKPPSSLPFSLRKWILADPIPISSTGCSSSRRHFNSSRTNTSRNKDTHTNTHTNPNPYPFPRNIPDPTPYQVFHLTPDATHTDIKHRYYELVRLYHPDAAESRRHEPDAARRHAVFSAITRAYAKLQRGETGTDGEAYGDGGGDGMFAHRWRRAPTVGRRRYEEPRFVDERWKDRIIWGVLGFSFVTVAAQTIFVRRRRIDEFSEQMRLAEGLRASPTVVQSRGRQSEDDTLRLQKST